MTSANPVLAEEQTLIAGMKRLQKEVVLVENMRPGVLAQAQRSLGANFSTPSVLRSPRDLSSDENNNRLSSMYGLGGGNLMDDDSYDQFGMQPCPASLRMMVNYSKETIHEKLTVAAISNTKECLRLIYQSRALLDRLLKEVPTLGEFHEGFSRVTDEATFSEAQRQIKDVDGGANNMNSPNNTLLSASGPVPNFGRRSNNNMSYSANVVQSAEGSRLQHALRGVKSAELEHFSPSSPSSTSKMLTVQLQNYIQEFKKDTVSFPTTHFTESAATGKISPRILLPPSGNFGGATNQSASARAPNKGTLTNTYNSMINQQNSNASFVGAEASSQIDRPSSTSPLTTSPSKAGILNPSSNPHHLETTHINSPSALNGGSTGHSTSVFSRVALQPSPRSGVTPSSPSTQPLQQPILPELSSQELQQFLLWLRQRTERMSSSSQTDETTASMVKGEIFEQALSEIEYLKTECREHLRVRQELTDLNESLKHAVMSRSAAVGHLRETLFRECAILKQQLLTLANEFTAADGNIQTVITNSTNYAAYLSGAVGPSPSRSRGANNNSVAGGSSSVLGNRSESVVVNRVAGGGGADKSVSGPVGRGSSFRNPRHNNVGNVSLMNAPSTPPNTNITALGDILQREGGAGSTLSIGRNKFNANNNAQNRNNSTSININVQASSTRNVVNNLSITPTTNSLIPFHSFHSPGSAAQPNQRLSTMSIGGAESRSVNTSSIVGTSTAPNLLSGRNSLQSSPQLHTQPNLSAPQTPKPPPLLAVPLLQQHGASTNALQNPSNVASPNAVLAAANQHLQSIPPSERAQFKAQTQHILTQSGGISITTIFSLLDAVLVGVEEGYTLRSGIDGTAMAMEVANTTSAGGLTVGNTSYAYPSTELLVTSPQRGGPLADESRGSSPTTANLPLNTSGRNSIAASRSNVNSTALVRTSSSPTNNNNTVRSLSVTANQPIRLSTSVGGATSRGSIPIVAGQQSTTTEAISTGPKAATVNNSSVVKSAQQTTAHNTNALPDVGGYNNLSGGIPNPLLFADMAERRVVVLQEELRARESKYKRELILMRQQQKMALARKEGEIKRLLESTNVEKLQDNIIATVTLAKEELMRMRDGVEVTLDNWRQEFQLFSSQISTVTIEMVREVRETRKALGAHRATLDLIRAACELYLPMLYKEYSLGVHPCVPASAMHSNTTGLPLNDPLWCHVNAHFGPEVAAELRHDIQRLQQFFLQLQKHSLTIHQQPQVGRPAYGTLMVKLGQQLLLSQSCTQDLAVQIREMLELEQFHSRELSRFTFKLVMVTFKQQTIVTRCKSALADAGLNPAVMATLPCGGIVSRLGEKLTSLRNLRAAVIKLRNDNAKKLWDLWFSNGIDIWGGKGFRGTHRRDASMATAQLQRHITMHGQLILGLMAPSVTFTNTSTSTGEGTSSPKGANKSAASEIDRRRSTTHGSTSSVYNHAKGAGAGTDDATFESAKTNMFRAAMKASQ